ncbi:chemotaxis response regulator protein-glutamate methylesterase [Geomicrobium sp. JSM 1781026]|uniref:protein-glutamate methylesterase/protein-glutamine glutaminase n=1 Tax=Geomicrobium sp. JSM 1781026 TaxID=3344580 RepID=UPI0035C0D577
MNVLIVDDSAFMRKWLRELIENQKGLRVVGVARNGKVALELLDRIHVDVMTLDIEMPVMDGLETLIQVMRSHPLPVIMVSSHTDKGAKKTLQAMEYGAIDVVLKPSHPKDYQKGELEQQLITKLQEASNVDVRKLRAIRQRMTRQLSPPPLHALKKTIVAIGTSTGGPRALQAILTRLPNTFPFPIVIVQHMPAPFTKTFADRLDGISSIGVQEAVHDKKLEPGYAYIAKAGAHLTIEEKGGGLYMCCDAPPDPGEYHRPSVNRLFTSLSQITNVQVMAFVLTGMGSDGKDGAKSLKENGDATVIAESKTSAVVNGMPGAIIEAGYADGVWSLEEIIEQLAQMTESE